MMIIDANNAILGRMATRVAKSLLIGDTVTIVNAEKAVITGNKDNIMGKYKEMADRGHRYKGPFFPKAPHRIVKRVIRGMIHWKSPKGRDAFKRLKVHIGVPEEFSELKLGNIPGASLDRSNAPRFVRVEDIAKHIGWKPLM